jgi:rhodanese-related sulfurtransferase
MRTILFAAVLALGAGACSKSETKKADKVESGESKIPLMSVADVDAAIAKGDCVAVDANGEKTRKKMGVVPGAVLLTDSEAFALSELPTDKAKQLVFYCGSVKCSASDEAANRAITAGYTNVKVMREGIAGWVEAGKKVQTL